MKKKTTAKNQALFLMLIFLTIHLTGICQTPEPSRIQPLKLRTSAIAKKIAADNTGRGPLLLKLAKVRFNTSRSVLRKGIDTTVAINIRV